jgi:hypothetical protein
MPFAKGQSGNPGGRPKGRQNNATQEIRALASSLFDKPYWERIKAQLDAGTLHPAIHAKLLAYAYGEPHSETHGKQVVVNLGFIGPTPSTAVIDDQDAIDATAQVMTLPARRRLT